MNYLIRKARIINPKSAFHHQIADIQITNGLISNIGSDLKTPDNTTEISFDNLHVSAGWFDTSVCLGEPGYEDRETITNGLACAAKSGFTGIALQPNTSPITDTQSQVDFLKRKSLGTPVEIFPIGALTKNSEGKDLAELYDMQCAGAVAFGDYNHYLTNANLMKIALQYAQDFNGLVIAFSQDTHLQGHGVVNEGIVSTHLGLKGIPNLAEELALVRNLHLLEYTGGRLHIPTVSTAQSINAIRAAKAKGLQVSCSVSVHHLSLTDDKLNTFDSNYKVLPPLRTEEDRQALIQGLLDNTIDCVTSDHNPIDIENKKREFDLAHYGTIGLESAFGALLKILPLATVIEKLTSGRKLFTGAEHELSIGTAANLTLFNPETEWTFTREHILSKSKNSAFVAESMKGQVYGVINQKYSSL